MGAPPIDIHVCQVLRHTYTLTMVQTLKKPSKKYYLKFPFLLPKPCFFYPNYYQTSFRNVNP